jgi:Xaa-Pro aminopeptidase
VIAPTRGFPDAEFRARTQRAQDLMARRGLSALLLTTEPEIRYYTGFLTRFWESPTRPWFVVLPAQGAPIAVIPAIGSHLMSQSWITDIRTWNAPDYTDDGIGLLAATLKEVVGSGGDIGMAQGLESHARMPLGGLDALRAGLEDRRITGDAGITSWLRRVKSEAEIEKIAQAAKIADRAFARVGEIAASGVPLSAVFRKFQMLCLDEGADWVPYLAGASARGGYGDVISPATDAPLEKGDVLMLDTGLVWDGYFCDFDRNFSIGDPSPAVTHAHHALIDATRAAFDLAHPGRTFAELHSAMDCLLGVGAEGGRLGHGLGMQLTEGPSIIPADTTILEPGMVLTLEPYIAMSEGKIMVHEENIVIRASGPAYLSTPASQDIRVL